ncbi:hypothetical protein ACJDU8_23025 [Clostridium sp. WILCCON 0269]|uniref:Uncharacterized protein n=1 Tax=Candidatus Clostridium eludens TaxID=3381663 RepID=A0ABW8SQS8_9CLOT
MNQKTIIEDLRQKVLKLQKRNKELTESCENFSEVDTNLWNKVGLLEEENKKLRSKLENVSRQNIKKVRYISEACGKPDLRCDYCRDGKCKSKEHGLCIFRKIEDWRDKEAVGV